MKYIWTVNSTETFAGKKKKRDIFVIKVVVSIITRRNSYSYGRYKTSFSKSKQQPYAVDWWKEKTTTTIVKAKETIRRPFNCL